MKIVAVIVTCNRPELLPRALRSVKDQIRKPDHVYVVSNSEDDGFARDMEICNSFGFELLKSFRTNNYAGALNTGVEEIVKRHGIADDIYFASLDDDDVWLPGYLREIEAANSENWDLIAANFLRYSRDENRLMELPTQLSEKDFLKGNPGIGGSNTFIRLKILLKAGCFDEALHSSVDRDLLVRVFLQKPRYKIIQKHLVTTYTDIDRGRLTTNKEKKISSLRIFFYKYQHLMTENDKQQFFERTKRYFFIERTEIETGHSQSEPVRKLDIGFQKKGEYQLVIGFISGDAKNAKRIAEQIVDKKISVNLVLIIEDIPKEKSLQETENFFRQHSISFRIVRHLEWKNNLQSGHYGAYFQQYSDINSIPLGRTILHHHLFTETTDFERPVFWIIDDDINFRYVVDPAYEFESVDVFDIINENIGKTEALIGAISNDPPVPLLSCIRTRLVDFYYSTLASGLSSQDGFALREKPDYYYDLSDLHSDHLEVPIYHAFIGEDHFREIWSGKAVSRPALQKKLKASDKPIARRGGNTLVFNRDLLLNYPVINLEVNSRHARRGDLIWAIFNQIISGRSMFEHTFSLEHDRPIADFDMEKELNKAAYDIIGYAFAKAILPVFEKIKKETDPYRPKDVFEKLILDVFFNQFSDGYSHFINRRKARFLMNYYRILGLTKLLSEKNNGIAVGFYNELADESKLVAFEHTIREALQKKTIKSFIEDLTSAIWSYSKSITEISENEDLYKSILSKSFDLKGELRKLGGGAEGIVFTDETFVYKCFFNILEKEWDFLKLKSLCFETCEFLEKIECHEYTGYRFVRYPFHHFSAIERVTASQLTDFLKFCIQNDLVFTNIKPSNFIQIGDGAIKLIDYGKSFEPFEREKFINSTKRAFLLLKYPKMKDRDFQKLTARINTGEDPSEIVGWEKLWNAVAPRKKEEILDTEIIAILRALEPLNLLDYGSGKCKTAARIKSETGASVFVYDIDDLALKTRCTDFQKYKPGDRFFDAYFDVALLNLVLCEVDNETVGFILSNIKKALRPSGKLVVSVCNPDFAHIVKTEFQNRTSVPQSKSSEEVVFKTCTYTGGRKKEYHRPVDKYLRAFQDNGFRPIETINTPGIDLETLEPASDFKIFVLTNVQ